MINGSDFLITVMPFISRCQGSCSASYDAFGAARVLPVPWARSHEATVLALAETRRPAKASRPHSCRRTHSRPCPQARTPRTARQVESKATLGGRARGPAAPSGWGPGSGSWPKWVVSTQ